MGLPGSSRGEEVTGMLVLMVGVSKETFRMLSLREKIQKLVGCLKVLMKVTIYQEKVQAVEGMSSDNGSGLI